MAKRMSPRRIAHTFRTLAGPSQEYLALRRNIKQVKDMTPDGDGRPVLFLPGFGTGDYSTALMRRFFGSKGYSVYGWDSGVNLGPTDQIVRKLVERLHEIHKKHDGQKVTLVGHSLGGVLARELARDYPHMVSQVITMGSPFGIGQNKKAASATARWLCQTVNYKNDFITDDQVIAQLLKPPPVPTTALYSRDDHVVSWRICINPKSRRSENIEVRASHIGLVLNQECYVVVADRLAQKDGQWKPFDHSKYPEELFSTEQKHHEFTPKLTRIHHKPHKSIFKPKP